MTHKQKQIGLTHTDKPNRHTSRRRSLESFGKLFDCFGNSLPTAKQRKREREREARLWKALEAFSTALETETETRTRTENNTY